MADMVFGINPVHEALSGGSRKVLKLQIVSGALSSRLQELLDMAQRQGVPVERLQRSDLDRVSGSNRHQGAIASLEAFSYARLDELLDRCQSREGRTFLLILDGITDPHNFGALLRSAEVVGCQGVIVPQDRSCPVSAVVEKTAAGALSYLPLCRVTNLARSLEQIKKAGIWCYGLAGEAGAEDLYSTDLSGHIALVVGSEGKGLRPNIRNHCDGLLAIPMSGQISSLNASVAAAVALFEARRQQSVKG